MSGITERVRGIPHSNMEDDFYSGYFIPKGATVMANIWFVLQFNFVNLCHNCYSLGP
ncbi:hypothetical protein AZE42_05711 [Rhizopogon vesiculosus]|uniref:Uncharacterized protein n=1 Tax=Rhizopogon vesiculosus TaxID=180088 RepID=A0A1J8PPM7_9AGAM|nr:hypothetical protein AZE42_05711 [Rhizopogon vesiculosus]